MNDIDTLRKHAAQLRHIANQGDAPDGSLPPTQRILATIAEILADHLERPTHGYTADGQEVTVRP